MNTVRSLITNMFLSEKPYSEDMKYPGGKYKAFDDKGFGTYADVFVALDIEKYNKLNVEQLWNLYRLMLAIKDNNPDNVSEDIVTYAQSEDLIVAVKVMQKWPDMHTGSSQEYLIQQTLGDLSFISETIEFATDDLVYDFDNETKFRLAGCDDKDKDTLEVLLNDGKKYKIVTKDKNGLSIIGHDYIVSKYLYFAVVFSHKLRIMPLVKNLEKNRKIVQKIF